MSVTEDESHFTLWCIMSFPLIMGHDVRNQSADTLRILTNKELLAVSADPMGRAARWAATIHVSLASGLHSSQDASDIVADRRWVS